jgi:16S rRNA (adenine1518-N6/adenine1519-N6)-dimethyltransferase
MSVVRPKKSLGQHFLKDQNIARKIVDSLDVSNTKDVLEIGPGMGVLTQYLIQVPSLRLTLIEIDRESIEYLEHQFSGKDIRILSGDFLKLDMNDLFDGQFSIIGNFPYNISSQIFFRILENRHKVNQVVGMIQKEVAVRFCAAHGNKTYGILSVLVQAFYDIDYLFTVSEHVFVPPPRVKSGVIRLRRNGRERLECDEQLFQQVVKTGFNQRRKVLRNALKPLGYSVPEIFAGMRAEQLSVDQFIELTRDLRKP